MVALQQNGHKILTNHRQTWFTPLPEQTIILAQNYYNLHYMAL